MNLRTLMTVTCLLVAPCLSVAADNAKSAALMQTLPVDGAWVSFDVTVYAAGQEFPVTVTARSVGKTMYKGKECRFIEYEQKGDNPPAFDIPQLGSLTWRMLVAEEEFGEGKDPISKALKTWVKYGEMPPESVNSVEQKDPMFAVLLQGPKKNLKIEDTKKKISWQKGDLECAIVYGQNDLDAGIMKLSTTQKVYRHPDVPFGVAGILQEMRMSVAGRDDDVVIKGTLKDQGKDAKPGLPELVP